MFVSVVVPTYNRRALLARSLPALLCQSLGSANYEIIVVDDCSRDDTQDYVVRLGRSASNLRYIRHAENHGRVRTRNDGIAAARGDVVVFLDDDNVPCEGFLAAHRECYASLAGRRIAVMGNPSYAPEIVAGSNFARYLQSRYLGQRTKNGLRRIDLQDLPARCFGTLNCSVRRSDLMAVGMFDVRFRYYGGEDEYMGHCLKQLGVRLVYAPEAVSIHYDDLSLARYRSKILEWALHGLKILHTAPEYLDSTSVRYLLPPSLGQDSIGILLAKYSARGALRPSVTAVLERWATLTDRFPALYSPLSYRAMIAGWLILGQQIMTDDQVLVRYEAASSNIVAPLGGNGTLPPSHAMCRVTSHVAHHRRRG